MKTVVRADAVITTRSKNINFGRSVQNLPFYAIILMILKRGSKFYE